MLGTVLLKYEVATNRTYGIQQRPRQKHLTVIGFIDLDSVDARIEKYQTGAALFRQVVAAID